MEGKAQAKGDHWVAVSDESDDQDKDWVQIGDRNAHYVGKPHNKFYK